ncbi:U3 small nucleolar RNA-associated protein 10 [Frankliniella fusca]|uniref:U3 small nucleolar RNA-associated protein 10 n=1 Tax=Frankliniella fusca TaxID=407009 RepID=A0AAE1I2L6_9NEOP|nr:U3 small nucleolar RNA-associated protein 10 [Frankliniella fusca]
MFFYCSCNLFFYPYIIWSGLIRWAELDEQPSGINQRGASSEKPERTREIKEPHRNIGYIMNLRKTFGRSRSRCQRQKLAKTSLGVAGCLLDLPKGVQTVDH